MKIILLSFLAIVLFHFPSPAQAKPEGTIEKTLSTDFCQAKDAREMFNLTDTSGKKTIMAVTCQWANAVRERDTSALEKLYDDDLFVTTHDGTTRRKNEELEAMRRGSDVKPKLVTTENLWIREFERMAIITALTRMHFVIKDKDVYEVYRYTAVFEKDGGNWRMRALQTVRIN